MSILLSEESYILHNALYCCYSGLHFQACELEDEWNCRAIYHFSIALIELLPIASQIVSLFEMCLAWIYYSCCAPTRPADTILNVRVQDIPTPMILRIRSEEPDHVHFFVRETVRETDNIMGGSAGITRMHTAEGDVFCLSGTAVLSNNHVIPLMKTLLQAALEWAIHQSGNRNFKVIFGPLPSSEEFGQYQQDYQERCARFEQLGLRTFTPTREESLLARKANKLGCHRIGVGQNIQNYREWRHLPPESLEQWTRRIQENPILPQVQQEAR